MSKSPATKRKTGCHAEKTSSLSVTEREESIGFELKRYVVLAAYPSRIPLMSVCMYVTWLPRRPTMQTFIGQPAKFACSHASSVMWSKSQKQQKLELCYQPTRYVCMYSN